MSDTISRSAAEEAILAAFESAVAKEQKEEDGWEAAREWYAACKCLERRQGLDRALGIAMRTLRDLPAKEGV